jgi:multidrug resistance efflux pump
MKSIKLITLFVLALSLTACGAATATPAATQVPTVVADNTIVTEGRLEPIYYAELALNASGLISEVLVKEGNQIAAGDVIARLESTEAQTLEDAQTQAAQELTEAYQEVRDMQYDFDNFDIPRDFRSMTPKTAVEDSLVKLTKARAEFEPYKDYNDKSLELTESEKENGVWRGTAKAYKKSLDDAWADYRKAIQWMDLETKLNNAKTRLANAQKDYDALNDPNYTADNASLRAKLANAEFRAPFAGIITDFDLKVGEFATTGKNVITIADMSSWVVKTTDLTEIDVVNVKEGQSVTVKLDALPDVELNGNVLSIAQNYSEKQGDIVYEVTVLLTETDPAMRWGMTAEVSFSK